VPPRDYAGARRARRTEAPGIQPWVSLVMLNSRRGFDALNNVMAKVSDGVATHLSLIETHAQAQPMPMLAR